MKTYEVLREGWLTNAQGHGRMYVPAAKGRKPVTIEMTDDQASYLLASGQIGNPGTSSEETAEVETVLPSADLPYVGVPQDVDTKLAPKGTPKARRIV